MSSVELRDGITEEEAVEYFRQMQRMFNGYFSSSAYRHMSLDEQVNEHETSLPKLLDFMLYGIDKRGNEKMMLLLRWLAVLALAALTGKLISTLRLPSILGWLIIGMFFGPHTLKIISQEVLDTSWYKVIIMWMQCAFGLMLGTELVWKN